MFDKNSIIIELVGYSTNPSRLVKIAKYYADKGYKIALTEYDLNSKWDGTFPYITMIKVDVEAINPKRLQPIVERIRNFNIQLVAEKVETDLQLQSLTEVGFNFTKVFLSPAKNY